MAEPEKVDESDRRSNSRLSDEELERIAQRAAQIVEDKFTLQVGKVAIRGVLYALGAFSAVVLGWLGISEKVSLSDLLK